MAHVRNETFETHMRQHKLTSKLSLVLRFILGLSFNVPLARLRNPIFSLSDAAFSIPTCPWFFDPLIPRFGITPDITWVVNMTRKAVNVYFIL